MATATSALRFDLFVRDRTKGGVDSASKRFGGLAKAGVALGAVGAVVGSAINKAASFEKTIAVAGAAAKASGTEMQEMAKLALDMGTKTQFGAQGAADAMVELSKSGLTVAQQRAGALAETMTLASAGGLELGSAATYMTNSLNTFRLKAEDASRVSTALAGGADASTASVESLGQALSQVGPGAKNAGLSLEDTVGVLAAFDNAGVKGSDAGTSLKTMLTRLVPATDKARDSMKRMGLDFTDAQGNFVGITEVAERLRQKYGGLSEEARTAALSTQFGSDATRAASILIDEGAEGLEKYIKATKDRSAVERAVDAQTKGAAGNMRKFKSALDTLQIVMGTHLLPVVTAVTGGLADLVTKVSTKVDPALGRIKTVVDDKVLPALGGLKDAASNAFSGVDFTGIATDLADEASKWAGSLMDGLRKGFDEGDWGPLGQSVGKGIGDALERTGELATTLFAWIGEQIKKVDWVSLGVAMGKQAPLMLAGLAIGILNFDLMGLLSGLGDHWFEVILGVLTIAFLPAKLVGAIATLLGRIPLAGPILRWGLLGIKKAGDFIARAAGTIALQFFAGLSRGLSSVAPRIANLLDKAMLAIVHLLTGGGPKIGAAVGTWGGKILSALASVPGRLARLAGEMVGRFLGALVKAAGRIDGWLGGWGGRILSSVGDLGSTLLQAGRDLAAGFARGIAEGARSVVTTVKDKLVNAPKNIIKGVGGFLMRSPSRVTRKYGQWFAQGFELGVKDWQDKVSDRVANMVDRIKAKFEEVRDFARDIRGQFTALADVSGIDTMIRNERLGIEREGGIDALLGNMHKRVADAERFAKVMTSLRKSGLNAATYNALREAGPEGGLKAAEQILGGGKAAISELNQLSAALTRVGTQFGNAEAKAKFGIDPNAKATATIKGGGQTIRLVLDPSKSGDKLTRAMVDALREWVRVNGRGNVQVALGAKK